MRPYELRAVVRWTDEKGEHAQAVVRDTKHWLYKRFEVDPKRPVLQQVAERLKVKREDIEVPAHIGRGVDAEKARI